ncbi:MAG: hypothetical protein HRF49_09755 [bacterium]|jgi:uncharacterized protein (UPF0332 family)
MKFDWSNYYSLAVKLNSEGVKGVPIEAVNRTCISRPYYSAFCLSRNKMLFEHDIQNPHGASSHDAVISHFGRNANPKWQEIAHWLKLRKRERIKADYHDDYSEAGKKDEFCLEKSIEIAALLKSIS